MHTSISVRTLTDTLPLSPTPKPNPGRLNRGWTQTGSNLNCMTKSEPSNSPFEALWPKRNVLRPPPTHTHSHTRNAHMDSQKYILMLQRFAQDFESIEFCCWAANEQSESFINLLRLWTAAEFMMQSSCFGAAVLCFFPKPRPHRYSRRSRHAGLEVNINRMWLETWCLTRTRLSLGIFPSTNSQHSYHGRLHLPLLQVDQEVHTGQIDRPTGLKGLKY